MCVSTCCGVFSPFPLRPLSSGLTALPPTSFKFPLHRYTVDLCRLPFTFRILSEGRRPVQRPPTFRLSKQRGRLLRCCRQRFCAGKQHTSPGRSCTVASSQLILTTQTQDQVAKKQCNLQLSLSVDTGVWSGGQRIGE